jgi:hypothetical protein
MQICGNAFIIKNDEIDAFESVDEINKVNQHQIHKSRKDTEIGVVCCILLPGVIVLIGIIIIVFKLF